MFGKNKVSQEEIEKLKNIVEIDERFFAGIADKKEMFDATVSDLTESFRQTKADLNQVQENIKSAADCTWPSGMIEMGAVKCGYQRLSGLCGRCRGKAGEGGRRISSDSG